MVHGMCDTVRTVGRFSRKLADYNDQYRTKRSVRPLADEVLDPLNQGLQVNGPMTLQQYAESSAAMLASGSCASTIDFHAWRARLRARKASGETPNT